MFFKLSNSERSLNKIYLQCQDKPISLAKYDVTGCLCSELWTNAMITDLNDSLSPWEPGGWGQGRQVEWRRRRRSRRKRRGYNRDLQCLSEKWCRNGWDSQGLLLSNVWRVIINPTDVTSCFSFVRGHYCNSDCCSCLMVLALFSAKN